MGVRGGLQQPTRLLLQGYKMLQGYKITRIIRIIRLQGYKDYKDYKAIRLQGYKATRLQGYKLLFNSLVAHKGPADYGCLPPACVSSLFVLFLIVVSLSLSLSLHCSFVETPSSVF